MHLPFAARLSGLDTPLEIRRFFEVPADPEVISFAGGNPSPITFPAEAVREIAGRLLLDPAGGPYQYGRWQGYQPLRQAVALRWQEKFSTGGPEDDVIITSGAQQAIDLIARAFLEEGDGVLCEEPSFTGAYLSFRACGAKLFGAPMGPDGMDLDAAEALLRQNPRIRLIYVIPTFQNPTGESMSLASRRALYQLAQKYDRLILEDDPYSELRYSGTPLPSIKSMDEDGRVLYAGSFSKVMFPGMRVGFAMARRDIVEKLTQLKQATDVHTNELFQRVVHTYLTEYDFDGHIAQDIVPAYRVRRDAMLVGLASHLPKGIRYSRPDGGLFILCTLPAGADELALARVLRNKKLAVVPGAAFRTDTRPGPAPMLRLNFSMPSPDEIRRGCALMGDVLGTALARSLF